MMAGKQMYGIAKSGEHAGEYTRCRAKDPNTCRYHVPGSHRLMSEEEFIGESERAASLEAVPVTSMMKKSNNNHGVPNRIRAIIDRLDRLPAREAYGEGVKILDGLDNPDDADNDALRTAIAGYKYETVGNFEESEDYVAILHSIQSPDGGATWDPRTKMSPVTGFCVSPYPERGVVVEDYRDPEKFVRTLNKFRSDNADLFGKPGNYIGLWNNPEDGKVYLDVSRNVASAEEARNICDHNEQIAFFDLQNYSSVETATGKTANTARTVLNDYKLDYGNTRIYPEGDREHGERVHIVMEAPNHTTMSISVPSGATRAQILTAMQNRIAELDTGSHDSDSEVPVSDRLYYRNIAKRMSRNM